MTLDSDSKIYGKLADIEQQLAVLGERCPTHLDRTDRHGKALYGRPGNGHNPGIVGRLDRVERTIGLYNYGLGAAWALLATLAVSALAELIKAG